MATAPNFLTAEQFEERYGEEKPYYEFWFGEAIQKEVPYKIHCILQGLIFGLLRQRGWKPGTELRLKISKQAFPIPDLTASSQPLEGDYPTEAVDLCVEILSPKDRLKAVFRKAAHYLSWGIGAVWIVDGEKRRAFILTLDHPEPVAIGLADSLTAGSGENAVAIPMRELFDELDKDLGKT